MILGSEHWPQTVYQLASQNHMFYISGRKSIDKNTRVGCHALLQGSFPIQGSNLCLLYWHVSSLSLCNQVFIQLLTWCLSPQQIKSHSHDVYLPNRSKALQRQEPYVFCSQLYPYCYSHAFRGPDSLRRTMQIVKCSLLRQRAQGRVSS